MQEQLKSLQQSLGLKGEDVILIEQPILEQAEVTYQEKLKEAEQQRQLEQRQAEALKRQQELERQEALKRQRQAELTRVDYTRLQDLLKAGQWKEADRETLDVMLKVTGHVSQGWLNFASIESFPCTDLRTIDQLWVKYSKGHFGFSVQKKIWQEVNGDYEAFGDRVG